MWVRPPRLRAAVLVFLGIHSMEATAMSPVPFFQRIEQVGVLCVVEAADGLPIADLGDAALCGRSVAGLSSLLASQLAVTALPPNDGRITAPGTLLVLVHATLRAENGQRLLALAAVLQRTGSASSAPFFMTPPQALVVAGSLDEAALDAALQRLFGPLARALQVNL